ncbi:MAG TPA: site-specific integrase, partial [Aquabacterium sp.]|nr:site-specific integrase [Aquabacterium sp.]
MADPHLDRFIDALWLEDGLSPNTLSAYRRDLQALADWLQIDAEGRSLV